LTEKEELILMKRIEEKNFVEGNSFPFPIQHKHSGKGRIGVVSIRTVGSEPYIKRSLEEGGVSLKGVATLEVGGG